LAWYTSRAILWAYDFELPTSVTAVSTWKDECPIDTNAILKFADDRYASLDCSFRNTRRQTLEIVGEKGSIIIPDFVLPFNAEPFWIPENTYNEESEFQIRDFNGQIHTYKVPECVQVAELVRTFVKDYELFQSGKPVSQNWGKMSIATQTVIDAIYTSSKTGATVNL